MKTLAQAHDELLISIAILEEKKTDADNARNVAKMRRELDGLMRSLYNEALIVETV